MALLPSTHVPGGLRSSEWIRETRARFSRPGLKLFLHVVTALVVLVVVGVAAGTLIGHVLASGIQTLLGTVVDDQVG